VNSAVEITEREGRYTARDAATGLTGEGATRATALLSLAGALQLVEDADTDPTDRQRQLRQLATETRTRFEDADTDETAVEEAIRWARSG